MEAAEALHVLNRQKTILFMLKRSGGSASRLLLTKWAFLLANETPSQGGNAFYQFLPYHYGPYSFSLAREISAMVRDGFMKELDGNTWNLTRAGRQTAHALPVAIERDVAEIMKKYGNITGNAMLASIYTRYPWFTVNAKEENRRAQTRPVATPAVHTLGYEGLMVDGFLDKLVGAGIQCLVDVRHNPVSRRYGFHKNTLVRLSQYLGIEYVHFPELGVPAESRTCLQNLSDYQELFKRYRRYVLPRQTATIEKTAKILTSRPSVLVCMEANPEYCHRSHLATALAKRTGLPIKHLATHQ